MTKKPAKTAHTPVDEQNADPAPPPSTEPTEPRSYGEGLYGEDLYGSIDPSGGPR